MARSDDGRKRTWRFRLNEGTILEVSAPKGATEKQVRRRGRVSLVLGTIVAAVVGTAVAYADNTVADGDGVVPIASSTLAFGNVDCGVATSDSALIAVVKAGRPASPTATTFGNGVTVTISVEAVTGTGLSAAVPATPGNQIALPGDWTGGSNGTLSSSISSLVTINSAVEGAGTGSVKYRASGLNNAVTPATITRDVTMDVSWTTGTCAPSNSAPTTPGAPTPTPTSPNQGGFTLDWSASADDGNPSPPGAITYELQSKDADDGAFTGVASASNLASNSYAFATGEPAEGAWTYRVRASDSDLTSDWSDSSDPVVVDRTAPTLGACPAGGPFLLNSGDQSVGSITATDDDLPDGSSGSGVDAGASTLSSSVDTSTVGSKSVIFRAVDNAGNSSGKTCYYSVIYDFHGFFRPIDNQPAINVAKAGSAIPVKFDLSGDQGLGIFSAGSPSSVKVACDAGADQDAVEETVTAGGSSLNYDSTVNLPYGQYIYVWKTDKAWAGTCRRLDVKLNDGTTHSANFKFIK